MYSYRTIDNEEIFNNIKILRHSINQVGDQAAQSQNKKSKIFSQSSEEANRVRVLDKLIF